jgi:hypothetical protein
MHHRILLSLLLVLIASSPASSGPHVDHGGSCRLRPETPPVMVAPRAPVGPLVRGSSAADEQDYVESVDEARYAMLLGDLSGNTTFSLDGQPRTITTRWANSVEDADGINLARDYVGDRFEAAGYEVVLQNFSHSAFGAPVTSTNVIAVKTGTVAPEEILVVGAHYDSRSESSVLPAPGAEDNASGTAAVIHLAELLADFKSERTIHFIAFGCEEYGLRGSTHYVNEALGAGNQIVGALTMDMISAWVDDFGVWVESTPPYIDLVTLVEDNVDQWTSLPRTRHLDAFGSDHMPFINNGIPAILAIEEDWAAYAPYHRSTDTFDKVDAALGTQITRSIAGCIADVAGIYRDVSVGGPEVPTTRSTRLTLHDAVPNPFNPRTTLVFDLPTPGTTRLEIFDLRGRRVRTLMSTSLGAGPHQRTWDGLDDTGKSVASGVYSARLTHPEGIRTRRLTLVR